MKIYLKLAAFAVGTLAWWGFLIPFLMSANDDMFVMLGLAAIVAYPVMAYKLLETEIKKT